MIRAAKVSVLVPVLNEARHLRRAAERMVAQNWENLEVLFIDGGSTDGTREVLTELARRDQRVRVFENPARTTPRALNIGLQAASGEFVARMDAHTLYGHDYLTAGVSRLSRGDVVSVSGPQLATGYDTWSRRVALALSSPLGVGGARFRRAGQEECEVDSGFAGLWRREVLVRHGGWDEDWVGDEDTELAARLRREGGRIVCLPEMGAQYAPRNSLRALARQYWSYGHARVRTSRRHPESLRPSQILPAGLALDLLLITLPWRALRVPTRIGALAYAAAVLAESARVGLRGAPRSDAAALPLVLFAMHAAYGLGTLAGCVQYGAPAPALRHVARTLAGRGRSLLRIR
jgi:succinoglycan biosynthesis protein ExoA